MVYGRKAQGIHILLVGIAFVCAFVSPSDESDHGNEYLHSFSTTDLGGIVLTVLLCGILSPILLCAVPGERLTLPSPSLAVTRIGAASIVYICAFMGLVALGEILLSLYFLRPIAATNALQCLLFGSFVGWIYLLAPFFRRMKASKTD